VAQVEVFLYVLVGLVASPCPVSPALSPMRSYSKKAKKTKEEQEGREAASASTSASRGRANRTLMMR